MPEREPNPRQTLAVLLGASSFRRASKLAQGRAFYNSALDFQEYLTSPDGLSLPHENVIWLFDDSRSPSDQLQDIRDFLESRSSALKNEGTQPQDLIVYYVGHGVFSEAGHTYCLAIRATDERNEGLTSIRASDLASIVKTYARFLRKFLILDCCFSAAAYKEFQSGPLQASRIKLLDELPQRGTTLLCSASAQAPSLVPAGHFRTMFSEALLVALQQGHPLLGPRLSLNELGDLIKLNLQETYPDNWVRPEVHSPDQREGDVAGVGIFPNAAYSNEKAEELPRNADAARRVEKDGSRHRNDPTTTKLNQDKQKRSPAAQNTIHVTAEDQQQILPLDICIETLGGVATPVIARNTPIPVRITEVFSTAAENQSSVEVHLLIGNRPLARDNRTLGKFHLTGIPLAARGVPQIEVAFDIDSKGILNVTAKDKATGRDQKITITASSGLSKEEVEIMTMEANAHAAEDTAKREEVDSRNQLDSTVYDVEKLLKEYAGKISSDERSNLEVALTHAKNALIGSDTRAMKSAREKLNAASHRLAGDMYQTAKGNAIKEQSGFRDIFSDIFRKNK